jgi:AraC family transcriptional regulator of arabinose operon
MDLDVLTRLTRVKRVLIRPSDATLAGLQLQLVGANRIDPPAGQDLHRTGNTAHHLTWIAEGQVLMREPGPQRLAGPGDVLVLPAGTTHSYASTRLRGWRALYLVFACPRFDRLGLRPGVMHPSPSAARALAALASLAATPEASGLRLVAGLATVLAELAASAPLGRADAAAEAVAALVRDDPLRRWDLPELARQHGLSWSALRQALRRRTGLSPQRLLRSARLALAAQRLGEGARVTDAAAAAGFTDPFHFSRLFRRAYGVPPRAWCSLGG